MTPISTFANLPANARGPPPGPGARMSSGANKSISEILINSAPLCKVIWSHCADSTAPANFWTILPRTSARVMAGGSRTACRTDGFLRHAQHRAALLQPVIESLRQIQPVILQIQALQPRIARREILARPGIPAPAPVSPPSPAGCGSASRPSPDRPARPPNPPPRRPSPGATDRTPPSPPPDIRAAPPARWRAFRPASFISQRKLG